VDIHTMIIEADGAQQSRSALQKGAAVRSGVAAE
jgi:hypothetical protein